MKLDEIREQAEIDLRIDKGNLVQSSIDTPILVNKYFLILIDEARILKILNNKQAEVYKELYDYYLHLAPPEAYIERPFNRKILKSDVEMYIGSDSKYTDIVNKIETQRYKVKYLEEIIKQFNNRTFTVKNIIAEKQFNNGGY